MKNSCVTSEHEFLNYGTRTIYGNFGDIQFFHKTFKRIFYHITI